MQGVYNSTLYEVLEKVPNRKDDLREKLEVHSILKRVARATADFEVEVRTGRAAGIAYRTDCFSLTDSLPDADMYRREVGVERLRPVVVLDDDV